MNVNREITLYLVITLLVLLGVFVYFFMVGLDRQRNQPRAIPDGPGNTRRLQQIQQHLRR